MAHSQPLYLQQDPSEAGPSTTRIKHAAPTLLASASASGSNSTPTEPRSQRSRRPWWTGGREQKVVQDSQGRSKRRTVPPYDLKTILKQSTGRAQGTAFGVEFFPFVGPKRPRRTRDSEEWDVWEDAVAWCGGNKVSIGRCCDGPEDACWQPIWEVALDRVDTGQGEDLYHVTWTVHPVTLNPMVIAAGKLGLIYVLDAVERRLVRTMKGHGDYICALAVCPTQPHILASASRDQTARIWNLYGHEIDPSPLEPPNENYPMGDADEGNHVVAILCGGWPGGHRDDVSALAWHPTHRAIATSGRDQAFKIWALPELPSFHIAKPSRSYRPVRVSWPLFSTNRIATMAIDSMAWLNEDIIIAHSVDSIVTFQWLSYSRYFERGTFEPMGDYVSETPDTAHWHDIDDSRSIMIISNQKVNGYNTDHRMGFHPAFRPTPSETSTFASRPNLVQDFLVAVPTAGPTPSLVLYLPTLAPPDPPPELKIKRRVDHSDFSDEEEQRAQDAARLKAKKEQLEDADGNLLPLPLSPQASASRSSPRSSRRTPKRRGPTEYITVHDSSDSGIEDSDDEVGGGGGGGGTIGGIPAGSSLPAKSAPSASTSQIRQSSSKESVGGSSGKAPERAYKWTLKAEAWRKIVEDHKGPYPLGKADQGHAILTSCAISPRGAKWIVGVGDAESVFIWRLRED